MRMRDCWPPGFVLAASPAGGQRPNLLFQLVPFVLIFLVFYFLLIVPARRKQRKHSEMLEKLRAGDRVLTTGGIYGTIVGVSDKVVQLRIADQVRIEIARHAVADIEQREP